MLTFDSFKAGKGDSFFLRWGDGLQHNLLIDGGVDGTYRFISQKIKEINGIDAILITHIDYDHIGGFFKLLSDSTYNPEDKPIIYLNTPDLLIYPNTSDLVKLDHGVGFQKELDARKMVPVPLVLGLYPKNKVGINGLELTILTPGKEVVDKLIENWTALDIYKQYLKGKMESSDQVSPVKTELKAAEKIIKHPPRPKKWDRDLINSSSISFLACSADFKILFLADANPDLVSQQLEVEGCKEDSRLSLDLVKISHHGSKCNTTADMLKRLDCKNYYISTDSSGPYYHPDRETIIMISEYGRKDKTVPINIFSNYELNLDRLLTKHEQKDLKINFEQKEHINFPLDE